MLFLRYKTISGLFVVSSIVYIAQSLMVEADKATLDKYDITAGQAKALALTITLPYIIIWFVALVGYLRLRAYTSSIKSGADGAAFTIISRGLLWLVLWLPLSAVIASWGSTYYHDNPASTANIVRLNNYFNLVILFAGFTYIYLGTKKLLPLIKKAYRPPTQIVTLIYISFSALYVLLTLDDSARYAPTQSVDVASYYQPDWIIVVTLLIPRLIMWFIGILAIQNLYLYSQKVKGSLYKAALDNLALGIGWVILTTIVFRCIQSLSSPIGQLSLGLLLVFIYGLLLLLSVGFVLIARGAKSLQKLEEL